ncbi:aspartyl/asparaginyl beta-hydroxylase domain-containing protein [Dyella humi]|uniref:Aspartyl/asparaginyl beta-hydroxylase domain-containing protein n=1 Tax=Dyella humi TaxID=1770547 RepID=A0ABW8IEA6_9GAMM
MASRIIGTIDLSEYTIMDDLNYLNSVVKVAEEYDEFCQGYWQNLSLMNASGEAHDSLYRNSKIILPTHHLKKCTEISRIIQDNFELTGLKMVRTRNLIDGMVIPHKDFVELNKDYNYLRLMIPLQENSQCFNSDEFGVFQMRPGEIWILDAAISHAAINFSTNSRIFLCLDYAFSVENKNLNIFNKSAKILMENRHIYINRKPMNESDQDHIIEGLSKIISSFTLRDLLFAVSKYHFVYHVPVTAGFDWLKKAAIIAGDEESHNKINKLSRYLIEARELGERFSLTS